MAFTAAARHAVARGTTRFRCLARCQSHHAVAYARVESTWERAQRLQAAPPAPKSSHWRVLPSRRRDVFVAAAVLLLLIGGGSWWVLHPEAYRTGVGERRTVALADGSRVELNTASVVRVDYSRQGREVWLQEGEALFDVAKDANRPFVVRAGNVVVQAVGTMFNVRLLGRQQVEVTVTEGVVTVNGRSKPTRSTTSPEPMPRTIMAGTGALAGPEAVTTVRLDHESLKQRTAWQRDLIELRGETLEQAVAEFNRYRTVPMVVGDPRIASIRIGGTFATGESPKFLAALRTGFNVAAVEGPGDTVYLVPAR